LLQIAEQVQHQILSNPLSGLIRFMGCRLVELSVLPRELMPI